MLYKFPILCCLCYNWFCLYRSLLFYDVVEVCIRSKVSLTNSLKNELLDQNRVQRGVFYCVCVLIYVFFLSKVTRVEPMDFSVSPLITFDPSGLYTF